MPGVLKETSDDSYDVEIRQQVSTWRDTKFRNVILLGFSFMVLFSAFQTCGVIQVKNSMVAECFLGCVCLQMPEIELSE